VIEELHARGAQLQLREQRRDLPDVVLQHVAGLRPGEAAQDLLLAAIGAGEVEDAHHRLDELSGEVPLRDVVGRPLAQGLDGGLLAAVGRHEDHRQSDEAATDGLDQLEAVHLGHMQVRQDDVRLLGRDPIQRLAPIAGVDGRKAFAFLEQPTGACPVERRVVDDEHDRHQPGLSSVRSAGVSGAAVAFAGPSPAVNAASAGSTRAISRSSVS